MEKELESVFDELYDAERSLMYMMDELKEDPLCEDLNFHVDRLSKRIFILRRRVFRLI